MRRPDPAAARVTVLGSINVDTVFGVPRLPRAGETVVADLTARHGGGKGANQAIAAARAGATVRLIGAVGDDADGRMMLALLGADRIAVEGVRLDQRPTGSAFITVDATGENQIVVAPGANQGVQAPARADGVLLTQLEVPVAAVRAFLTAPRDGTAILNAAPFQAEAATLLTFADIVVVNEVELAGYAGVAALPADTASVVTLAERLRQKTTQTVVVTRGGAGSVAVGPAGVLTTAAPPAEVVDTTAAGDCFCGYLGAELARGGSLAEAIAVAHAAAAVAVGRAGAAPSIPRRAEIGAIS